MLGWNFNGIGVAGLMPEFRLDGTCGLYVVLVVAGEVEASIPITGGFWVKRWCPQMAPGGRPSIGPVRPVCPPTSLGSSGCCVWLACACGAGLNDDTGFRWKTSKRGIGCVNGRTPKSGLLGKPVGMPLPPLRVPKLLVVCAFKGRTNGLSPPIGATIPAEVKSPHFTRSRRDTCPCDSALLISARFLRAFSASLILPLSLFSESQNLSL